MIKELAQVSSGSRAQHVYPDAVFSYSAAFLVNYLYIKSLLPLQGRGTYLVNK